MEKLGLNEIRNMFRDFYVSKGHYSAKSASLVPQNDKSLLIINSGMAPLKPYFAGVETPPSKRMTTCQKCIRTGDIDNVGITSRHGTFFEMLGNFSFGDYFKEQSLTWGWEFITEYLKLPADKVWATVYEDDDEAALYWEKLGMPKDRIVRLGKDDNFWEIGLGPCGPCSEIFFDRGPEYGCGKPDCKPGCECDRYLEFWNHVFTQFSKEEDGSYSNLAHPNIDTGMGLERIACIMQNVDSIFDIDTIKYILDGVVKKSGIKYEGGSARTDISIRIVTDHLRSIVFMIGDGIIPSNEGRGYVLRRLLRRAIRHGKLLGIKGKFLVELSNRVMEVSGEAYPEIIDKKEYIDKIIFTEENKFAATIDQGMEIILEYIASLKASNCNTLDGKKVFKLYDTYGFPLELTEEILAENNIIADVDGFNLNMEKQKEMARKGRKSSEGEAWKDSEKDIDLPKTLFTGYERLTDESEVIGIYRNDKSVKTAEINDCVQIYLDKTPFYAESGGQCDDNGIMSSDSFFGEVVAVTKFKGLFCHKVLIKKGHISVGDKIITKVNAWKRNRTAQNHTATHLLQKALVEVLGNHVQQAGSNVNENVLRFDFTHFESITKTELVKIEEIVNLKIGEFLPVVTKEMSIKEAQKTGATALFGEKYGKVVRVVNSGDWSVEFCGGTHVANTGQIGVFKIVSETGVAAGVRRIEAVTGMGVLEKTKELENTIEQVAEALKSNTNTVVIKVISTIDELKKTKKELDEFKKISMKSEINNMIHEAKKINGINLITKSFVDYNINDLRKLSDEIKALSDSLVLVFATVNDSKVTFLVSITDDLLGKGYHAGNMIKKIAAAAGGGGGGKADIAQAGAKNPLKIKDAFLVAEQLLK